jgi:branched-chain amino acid transport system substrate-binding protein
MQHDSVNLAGVLTSRAKIIGIASGPADNMNAIKLGGEFGIFQGGQQMAGLLFLITDVHALGLKAAEGLLLRPRSIGT